MAERTFDRETLLDLTVNVIPLVIILFFVVVFLIVTPWAPNTYMEAVSMGLLVIPFVALAAFTYFSGRIIQRDERRDRERAAGGLTETGPEMDAPEDDDGDGMVEDTMGESAPEE